VIEPIDKMRSANHKAALPKEQIRLLQPAISVVIPCHNHGDYLDEAVQSVEQQTFRRFEIVIIDDGSNDEETLRKLNNYDRPNIRLIHTPHLGLPNARNAAIRAARGKYILPLDADDKIDKTYLQKAIHILDANENVGIVYSKADLFGEGSGEWKLPPYHFPEILFGNAAHSLMTWT